MAPMINHDQYASQATLHPQKFGVAPLKALCAFVPVALWVWAEIGNAGI